MNGIILAPGVSLSGPPLISNASENRRPTIPIALAVLNFDKLAEKATAFEGGPELVAEQRKIIESNKCTPCGKAKAASVLRLFLTKQNLCETGKEG